MNLETKKQIIDMFCKDMSHPLVELALHRSFRKWADLRDKLAAHYESKTGIPADELTGAYALHVFSKE